MTTSTAPKFPDVHVQLTGTDGNVFAIMGRVEDALRKAGATHDQICAFCREMEAGDYDDALRTVMRWVRVS